MHHPFYTFFLPHQKRLKKKKEAIVIPSTSGVYWDACIYRYHLTDDHPRYYRCTTPFISITINTSINNLLNPVKGTANVDQPFFQRSADQCSIFSNVQFSVRFQISVFSFQLSTVFKHKPCMLKMHFS